MPLRIALPSPAVPGPRIAGALAVAIAVLATSVARGQSSRGPGLEFAGELGLDLLRTATYSPSDRLREAPLTYRQPARSPAAALGVSRRIEGLRAYYGLRVEGHAVEDGPFSHRTSALMLTYRAFAFDLHGDCDCPTWGRDNYLQRALFVEFGAGVGARRLAYPDPGDILLETGWGLGYMARLGIAHLVNKSLDVYLAGGAHGVTVREPAVGEPGREWVTSIGLRPVLGVSWRLRG